MAERKRKYFPTKTLGCQLLEISLHLCTFADMIAVMLVLWQDKERDATVLSWIFKFVLAAAAAEV